MLQKILYIFRTIIEYATLILFLIMVASVLIQVMGRYVFNYSISWAIELATFSQVWLVILGTGIAVKDKMHAGVDVLITQLPLRFQRAIGFIIVGLCLCFLVVTLWGTQQLLMIGSLQTSPVLEINMAYVYLIMPVGVLYIMIELILSVFSFENSHKEETLLTKTVDVLSRDVGESSC